jgi:hypothetical protein
LIDRLAVRFTTQMAPAQTRPTARRPATPWLRPGRTRTPPRSRSSQGLREGDGGDDHGRDDHVAKPANQARAIAIAIITDSVVDQL